MKTKPESLRRTANMVPEARRQNSKPLKLDLSIQLLREQQERQSVDSIRSMPKSTRQKRAVEYGIRQ